MQCTQINDQINAEACGVASSELRVSGPGRSWVRRKRKEGTPQKPLNLKSGSADAGLCRRATSEGLYSLPALQRGF